MFGHNRHRLRSTVGWLVAGCKGSSGRPDTRDCCFCVENPAANSANPFAAEVDIFSSKKKINLNKDLLHGVN